MSRRAPNAFFVLSLLSLALAVHAANQRDVAFNDGTELSVMRGFKLERVMTLPYGKASWIGLATDGRGKFYASDESGPLYSFTVGAKASPLKTLRLPVKGDDGKQATLGHVHGMLWSPRGLYAIVNGHPDLPTGLYLATDADGDGELDAARLLTAFNGGGEHGPHSIAAGPDGKLYIVGGNDSGLPEIEYSALPLNWTGDQLLAPEMQDKELHTKNAVVPGGWVCRVEPDGSNWTVFAAGMRNSYDLAFDAAGELFVADSDEEWQLGLPWYRAPRICHVTAGADFGWRCLDYAWPAYFPDAAQAVVDLPRGSPSGMFFGTQAKLPEQYQRALFVLDWAAGRLQAVHLDPRGAGFSGETETIVEGRPFAAVDGVVGADGAIYVITGGRGSQTHLYRLTHADVDEVKPLAPNRAVKQRRALEDSFRAEASPSRDTIDELWPHLGSGDLSLRGAARTALEHQPLKLWKSKLLDEPRNNTRAAALLAAVRVAGKPDRDLERQFEWIEWWRLSERGRLELLRAQQIYFCRFGFEGDRAKLLRRMTARLAAEEHKSVRMELMRLSAFAGGKDAIAALLALDDRDMDTGEKLQRLYCLNSIEDGWEATHRAQFVRLCAAVDTAHSGKAVRTLLNEWCGQPEETPAIEASVDPKKPGGQPKQWTLADFEAELKGALKDRNFVRGEHVFKTSGCIKCHLIGNDGGEIGPDLTFVGNRFSRAQLLESILDPNKIIPDRYRARTIKLKSGDVLSGLITDETGDELSVVVNAQEPAAARVIAKKDIVSNKPSQVSPMPEQLMCNCSKDDILDLLAYLIAGGNRQDRIFRRE